MTDSITGPGRTVPAPLASAIAGAGNRSAVDFDYLVKTAIRESSLNPEAAAKTSSASGLFQFIDSTWLQVMRDEGPRLGYADLARHIGPDGSVDDPAVRRDILGLKEDPQVSADLAAAYTRRNGEFLTGRFGRSPSPGELYIAHVLGAEGAATLFSAGLADPERPAAPLFPEAARANRTIFFDGNRPRSIREVYGVLTRSFEAGSASFAADALPSRFSPGDMNFTSLFSTEAAPAPRALISAGSPAPGGAALFSQLYGQGQAAPLVTQK